ELRKVDTLVVDKTGTLTEGRPSLVAVEVLKADEASGLDEGELLRLAAGLEKGSEHPLAEAIVKGAEERGLTIPKADRFESFAGMGVAGVVAGRRVALGNLALLKHHAIDPRDLPGRADAL